MMLIEGTPAGSKDSRKTSKSRRASMLKRQKVMAKVNNTKTADKYTFDEELAEMERMGIKRPKRMDLSTKLTTSTRGFSLKILFLFILFVIDTMAHTAMDMLWGAEKAYRMAFFAASVLCQFATLFGFLLLLWNTFFLQFGLVGEACAQFSPMFLWWLGRLVFLVFTKGGAIRSSSEGLGNNKSHGDGIASFWEDPFMQTMNGFYTGVSIVYYGVLLRAAYQAGKSCYYSPLLWHYARKRMALNDDIV